MFTKIIVLKMKHGDVHVFARDAREEERAYLFLFKIAEDNGYYVDLDSEEVAAHAAAKEGSGGAAKWLLNIRANYEYERLDFIYPEVP